MKTLSQVILFALLALPVSAQDADQDGASDSLEIATGFDPDNNASTPPHIRAIGINFADDDIDPAFDTWGASLANGFIPQSNWNHLEAATVDINQADIDSPTAGTAVDAQGSATSLKFTSDFRFSSSNRIRGGLVENLFSSYLLSRDPTNVNINVSDVPYANYDVYVYVSGISSLTIAEVTLNKNSANPETRTIRPYLTKSEFSFVPERRTLGNTFDRINVVKFPITGQTSFSVSVARACGIGAIQIVDRDADADSDQLPDWWELLHRTDASNPTTNADPDGDLLDNLGEFLRGTDPNNPDSDSDKLSDKVETNTGTYLDLNDTGTDPNFSDSDEDGTTDYAELYHLNQSDPNKVDSDDDGLDDDVERDGGVAAWDPAISGHPLPSVSTPTEFLWETKNVQLLWNHDRIWNQSSFNERDHNIILTEIENTATAPTSANFFRYTFRYGFLLNDGKLTTRFYSLKNGGFHAPGRNLLQINSTEDLSRECGFSGVGASDLSDLLTFSVAGQKTEDSWTITLTILNQSTGQEIYRHVEENVDADSTINNGTSIWRSKPDNVQVRSILKGNEIEVLISAQPIQTSPAFLENLDANNDGISDSWAATYSITDPNADPDGDNLSNYAEFLAGTNPTKKDTDDDGVDDDIEFASFTNATDPDSRPYFTQSLAPTGGDFDNNGLSDLWERRLAPFSTLLPNSDPDADGFTNQEESWAGTDPFSALSFPNLSITPAGTGISLTWPDFPQKQTTLLESVDLTGFTPLTGTISSGIEMSSDEAKFFKLSITDLDQDFDGVTDAEENFLGTNPLMPNSVGRPIPLDQDNDGTIDRTLSGDYAYFAERYSNNHQLNDGQPGNIALSPREASRFLMQTTFGPRQSDIEELRSMGIDAWIDDQIHQRPASSYQDLVNLYHDDLTGSQALTGLFFVNPSATNDYFLWGRNFASAFATHTIKGKDQLRQRAAFALSQIFVISRQNDFVKAEIRSMANFYDMLSENAFGNYYELLRKVSRHPMMGIYLSSIANLPPDPPNNRYPDENYGREVMQLFTIGIHLLNNDGTFKLNDDGLRIETYDQFDVTEMARVMTGLARNFGGGSRYGGSNLHPMRMFFRNHDFAPKEVIKRHTIPAREPSDENAEQDLDDALLILFNHENTPPFVSKALIQFLITDNPSPAYVERVANVFKNDGSGVRGNLEAVWKAILLDPEARDVALADTQPQFGRLRDPVIRVIHLARLLKLDRFDHIYWWEPDERYTLRLGQAPLNASSVFNFYKPDYQPPGPLIDNGLVGGPFEIVDTNTAVGTPNYLWSVITEGLRVGLWGAGYRYDHPPSYEALLPYAEDTAALLDHINLVACAGRMNANTRAILLEQLTSPYFANGKNLVEKVCLALYGAAISPEAAVSK